MGGPHDLVCRSFRGIQLGFVVVGRTQIHQAGSGTSALGRGLRFDRIYGGGGYQLQLQPNIRSRVVEHLGATDKRVLR